LKFIVVAGSRSGIGKTAAAERILRKLRGWSAIKVTTVKESNCPRRVRSCSICQDLKGDYEIIKELRIIQEVGTDTARLKEAGAKRVLWLKASLKGLEAGIKEAVSILKDAPGVVIEGSSVLRYINPDLVVYLRDNKDKELKVSSDKSDRRPSSIIIGLHKSRSAKND
jgi:molybdopterin-guanine dinucleotide biosynthesis protein